MMTSLEKLAMENGINRLRVHAASDAVPFYEKLGWIMVDADKDSPIMMKELDVQLS